MSDNMEHNDYCRKEGELASLNTKMKRISKIVEGNGQPGLDKQMTQLNTVIPELQKSVAGLSDKVQLLLDKDIAATTERTLKLSAKQKMTAIISGIIGAGTVIVMIADMILKNKAG